MIKGLLPAGTMLEMLGSLGWHGMDETNPIPSLERRRSEKRKMETEATDEGHQGSRGEGATVETPNRQSVPGQGYHH